MAQIKKNKQLLVEGKDDLHVLCALCQECNIPKTFDILDCEGIDKLIKSIPVRLKQSDIDTIGIVVDADADLNKRWKEIGSILTAEGYTVPQTINSKGLKLREEGKISIGVWLMPNNNDSGMLEDFIKFLVPNNDILLPIAKSTLNSLEMKNLNSYKPIHQSKALIHTWLAWQQDPGTPMGLSITKKYLDATTIECTIFVDWLKDLFK